MFFCYTIALLTPQFAECNSHPQVNLNNSLLHLERTPVYWKYYLWPSLQIQCTCQISSHPGFTPYQHPQGSCWYQLELANHTYHIYVPFHECSSHLVPSTSKYLIHKLQNIQNSALRIATGCIKMTSIDHLHEETKMPPIQDHLSLFSSKYLSPELSNLTTFPTV